MRRWMIVTLMCMIGASLLAQEVKKVPARYTSPAQGAEMYKAYCASCHGTDGKGGGPAATALKIAVPDLTQMAKKNAGKFPADHVGQVIMGDSLVPAHGSKEMPVWGPTFLALDQRNRATVMLRAKNLTQHIESLQAK